MLVEAQRLVNQLANQPFNLQQEPLLRSSLLQLGEQDYIFVLVFHHIVADGWSIEILERELSTIYTALCNHQTPVLPKLPIQYADFTIWQRSWFTGEVFQRQLNYWQQQLKGIPSLLELPTDRPRPAIQTYRGAQQPFKFSVELSEAIVSLSKRMRVTPFMLLLAAFQTLLYRYTGQDDIVVGTPIANRHHREIEGLIGFFVNTLALRTDLSGNPSFEQLLGRVQEVALGAHTHQDLPFEQLVEALQPERSLTYTPLFQVMFALDDALVPSMDLPDLTVSSYPVETRTAKFDLTLSMENTASGLRGAWEYNSDLFDAATIARYSEHFLSLLEGIVANPIQPISQLPLLTEAERQQLLVEWNNTFAEYPHDKCIHQLFEEQVERLPSSVAVVFEGEPLTYRELNARANQLAHYLLELGVGPEVLVGICVERSLEMIIGLLGILKAGGAYVPIDPTYPKDRLAFMLKDSSVSVLLTQQKLMEKLPAHSARVIGLDSDIEKIAVHSQENPGNGVKPENLAYVIYTSGSTGKPKGVLIPHGSLVNYTTVAIAEYGIQKCDRILQFSSISFDVSAEEIYTSLTSGATLVLRTDSMLDSVEGFLQKCKNWEITVVALPTAYWHELTALLSQETLALPPSLRLIIIGGEKALPERLKTWLEYAGQRVRLLNNYGPTEATVGATIYDLSAGDTTLKELPIGRPLGNVQTYILDRNGQPVPIGVPGELHIGGAGLARGYLNRPELTDERFIRNPFSDSPTSRLYKTGDLVRYLNDGNIEYLGRIDDQVKVRGFRIELGEIEAALSQHPSLLQVAVALREDIPGQKSLVAYTVLLQEPAPTISELRHFLKQQLPDYMIPSAFVVIEALPLTPNGKVDRRALRAPDPSQLQLQNNFVAPRTPIEEMLAEIWTEVLTLQRVGIFDNFFELGGHSLLATQVISRVRQTFQVELPLRSLFASPTIADLALCLEEARREALSLQVPPIQLVDRNQDLPLYFAQQRLWFLDQLVPNTSLYNVPEAFRLSGNLNVAALDQSLCEIVKRHEILRTTFTVADGKPVLAIAQVSNFTLPVVDLRELKESDLETKAIELLTEAAGEPFHLAVGPLLRCQLFQLNEQEYIFLVVMHHIITDGWSMGVFFRELTALYEAFSVGATSPLQELPIQYADFAVWQQQWLSGEILERQLAYWKQQLAGVPAVLNLPTDRPRPSEQTFRGATQSFVLSESLSKALVALSQRQSATLFMTLLTAFQTLLYRYTGQDDIVVGSPIANRHWSEIEGLIGFFVNTLVLRTDLGSNPSFEQLLGKVKEVALQAYAHQDLPFEQLVEALQPDRSLSHTPLFQVMFALDNASQNSVELPGLALSSLPVESSIAKFDLALSLEHTDRGLIGSWEYNTDLFDRATIARMAGHFQTLLEAIAANSKQPISELPLLTPTERHQILVEWNNTSIDYPQDKCIHQLFEEQVERSPDAVAVVFQGEQLTYQELNAKANQLAHYLRSQVVGLEVLVGICVERSFEMIVGILGVLKAGGAYIPIDPAYPSERIAYMLDDSGLSVLLTQKQLVASLPKHQAQVVCLDSDWEKISTESELPPITGVTPENLAYVIYTSGSTGKPKGVLIPYSGLLNLVFWHQSAFEITSSDRATQLAGTAFDASVWEVWPYLTSGASIYLIEPEILLSPEKLRSWVVEKEITITFVPTPIVEKLLSLQWPSNGTLRIMLTGGDQLHNYPLTSIPFKVVNNYGPTENTVVTTSGLVVCDGTDNRLPYIGRPIANTQIYILDRHLQPVPIGIPGELHIAGVGLAKGYLNRPDLTDEKFIPNPFSNEPGSRLYKTGDLARYLPDGNIEYLGRIDNQVKIRGFRIELGEIEALLGQHPDVLSAAVIDREDTPGNKRLVAYVVSNLIPDRILCHSECQLELDGNAITLHAENISTGGVALVGVPALDKGRSVRLHLQLPGEAEPRWFSGTVVWSRPPQAGVQFQLAPSEQTLVDQSFAYLLETQGLWKTLQRALSGSLRDYLKQKLPEYMIPSAFVLMKALPLTPNGKIDRRALPAPDSFHNKQKDKFVGPRTPTEAKLAAIWAEVLGVQESSINDNFFELGGHSLLATQIISRIRQAFAIELPLRHLFEAPTIASLSEIIETALDTEDLELFSYGAESDSQKPLAPATREGYIPLSLSQEYIWYVQQLNPDSCGCNSGVALRFTQKLSNEVLDRSINEIIRRHEILRTTFPVVEGQPVQAIAPELTLPLNIVNLQDLPTAQREAEALHISQLQMNHHFDLANGPLIKTTLLQLSSEEHWLLVPMHHIITDGWSVGIFLQELETLYNAFSLGLPSPLPEVPLQYADFTIWQRQQFNEEVLAQQLSYWLQKLATPEQPQEYLPPEDSKSNSSSRRASSYSLVLRENIVASLEDLSRSHSVTISTILIAALKLLLFKYHGQSEIMIVATIGNRSTPEIEKMLGCFINDVILRSQLDDEQTGVALLEQVKETLNEAISNKEIPLQQVIEAVKSQRKLTLSASVTIVPPVEGSDGRFVSGIALGSDKDELWDEEIPLELYISSSSEESKSMEIYVFYSTDLFDSETIEQMFNYYQEILQKLAESPQMKIAEFEGFQEKNREAAK